MEMPQNCINCDLRYECNAFYAPGKPKPFMKGCRIVCQLPEGHGRLVDADACASVLRKLENEAKTNSEKLCYGYAAKMFEEAFTIVPAAAERSET
jgi:hypothetical protein